MSAIWYMPPWVILDVASVPYMYIMAMILSNYCIYHHDVKTIVLHAYCKYTTVFRTGLQGRTVCNWLVIPCINIFEIKNKNKSIFTLATMQQAHHACSCYCKLFKAFNAHALKHLNLQNIHRHGNHFTSIQVKYRFGKTHCIISTELSTLHR